ncbi:MAG: hypothetical protein SFU20_03405 [Chitinophagaceae bacterium]|nr:hypothetical protein [Chitinophagaceae bacterium]
MADNYMENSDVKQLGYVGFKTLIASHSPAAALFAELLGWAIESPWDKRREDLLLYLYNRLRVLEEKQEVNLKELSKSDEFIDVLTQAVALSVRASQEEKINALRNTVINTATNLRGDHTKRLIFLTKIESFTEWHIILLRFLFNPQLYYHQIGKEMPNYVSINLYTIIEDAIPYFKNEEDLISVIWQDLYSARFITTSEEKAMLTAKGAFAKRTTLLGDEFLAFISAN